MSSKVPTVHSRRPGIVFQEPGFVFEETVNAAEDTAEPRPSRNNLWLGVLLFVAMAVRLVLAFVRPDDLLMDADGYIAHSQELLRSGTYAGPYSHLPTAFRPPAYPFALGVCQFAGCSAWSAVLVINLLSIVCIVLCADRLTRRSSGTVRLLTLSMIVFDPLLLRYSVFPMTEVPCAAVLLLAVTAYAKSCQAESKALIWAACCGVFFAVAALIRPTVAVCLALAVLVDSGRSLLLNSQPSFRGHVGNLRRVFVVAVMFAAGLSPWVIRNALQFHRFIPATTHGGYTLALGNNPSFYRDVIHGKDAFPWDGSALDTWQRETLDAARNDGVDVASETQLDAWYYDSAKSAMKNDPAAAFKAVLLRISRFWALSTAETASKSVTLLLTVWYGFLWSGLCIKLVLGLRGQWAWADVLLAACILGFALMHTVYWTDTRMRTPVMPMLIILSVSGWSTVSGWSLVRRQ